LFEHRVLGKPLGVWLLWAAAVGVLATCPVIISDPGMWPYLLDPELLALVVVVGLQYTRIEIGVLRLQALAWWATRRQQVRGRAERCSTTADTRCAMTLSRPSSGRRNGER
jgi:hypothetical protein